MTGFSGSIGMIAMVVVQVTTLTVVNIGLWLLLFKRERVTNIRTCFLQIPMTALGVVLMDISGRRPLLMVRGLVIFQKVFDFI